MTHAQHTAGFAAAVARASVHAGNLFGLGYGWQLAAIPCGANGFALTGNAMTGNATTGNAMASAAFKGSTKRSPRRLGQRST